MVADQGIVKTPSFSTVNWSCKYTFDHVPRCQAMPIHIIGGDLTTHWRDPSGELRDQAGTYVNLIASSPIRSLATRRSGGRGPAKNGLPRPSTTGRK